MTWFMFRRYKNYHIGHTTDFEVEIYVITPCEAFKAVVFKQ